jgi:aminoglycoside 3-N-acetyltransferase
MRKIDKDVLKKEFSRFLKPRMKIMVHSSLSSLGFVEGGAKTVIHALMEIITSSGLIMMPAFTYGRQPFKLFSSPAQTGRIPETFRQMKTVKRSSHPTHSFCAWGKTAEAILSDHYVAEPFKIGTPLHKFAQQHGYMLLIGVTNVANSLIHVAQELADVPYLDRTKIVQVIEGKKIIKEMLVRRAGCSLGFDKVNPLLEKEGLLQRYRVGESTIIFMKAKEILKKVTLVLKLDPYLLACDNPDCYACNEMKRF